MAERRLGAQAAGTASAGMKAAAGSGNAAVKFSQSLASIKPESWKSGKGMMEKIADIDWDKGSQFFHTMQSFMGQFGIFSELIQPLMDMFEIMDATIIQENVDEITAWNEGVMGVTKSMQAGIREFKKFEQAGGRMYNSFTLLRVAIEVIIGLVGDFIELLGQMGEQMGEFYGGFGRPGGKGSGRRKSPAETLLDIIF